MPATTVIFYTGTRYNTIRRPALLLGSQRHVRPNYKVHRAGNVIGNPLQNLSAVILLQWFSNGGYKTIVLVADYFSVKLLISTRFMSCHVTSIRTIVRNVEFFKGKKKPHFGSTPNEPKEKASEFIEGDYTGPTMDTAI